MALAPHIQKIVDKINAGEELTHAEEVICFTVIHGYPKEEAERLVSAATQKARDRRASLADSSKQSVAWIVECKRDS